jgi:hypothetical protein
MTIVAMPPTTAPMMPGLSHVGACMCVLLTIAEATLLRNRRLNTFRGELASHLLDGHAAGDRARSTVFRERAQILRGGKDGAVQ